MAMNLDHAALVERVGRLLELAERRAALLELDGSDSDRTSSALAGGPRERSRALLEHARNYLLPRARDLDAPLVVVLLGSTGAGKSTLINTLAGRRVSQAGVLRPTTRDAVVVATPTDARVVLEHGSLSSLPRDRFEVRGEGARPGVVLADAPDIDSIEHGNRVLADTLLELADLCVFVTTASRYADRVPWDVLGRVEQRGLPIIVVVNRLPPGPDGAEVMGDVRVLMERTGLAAARGDDSAAASGAVPSPAPGRRASLEIIGVPEGAVADDGQAFEPDRVSALIARIDGLAADRDRRRAVAVQALEGAIAGLAPLAAEIAADLERSAGASERLLRIVDDDYAAEWKLLVERLARGNVLREEVIRQWHSFVGADQITRLFSHGIGRIRGAILAGIRGTPAPPVAVVQTGASDDVTALVLAYAGDAARRTASDWSGDPIGSRALARDAALWSASPDIELQVRAALDDWVRTIASDVARTGASKQRVARGVSVGVNAGAVTVMLAVFVQTGGLTGAEVGIAAATAFLNQKLMNAIFGEAAVQEMIERARDGLRARLAAVLEVDAGRFRRLVAAPEELQALARELRAETGAAPSPDRSGALEAVASA